MNSKNEFKPLTKFPNRNALALVDAIKKYTENKNVVDMGCSTGDLIYYMLHKGYCKDILGIELDKNLCDEAKRNGRDKVINGDHLKVKIPSEFDVYYSWNNAHEPLLKELLTNIIPSGSIMIDGTSDIDKVYSKSVLEILNNNYELLEDIEYEYDETIFLSKSDMIKKNDEYYSKKYPLFACKGKRHVRVYKKSL